MPDKTMCTAKTQYDWGEDHLLDDKEIVQPARQIGRRPQEQQEEWFGKMPKPLPWQPENI